MKSGTTTVENRSHFGATPEVNESDRKKSLRQVFRINCLVEFVLNNFIYFPFCKICENEH